MADDTERLIVLLEARLTDFERNMLKASGVSQKNFNQIKKQSRSATRQMEQDMIRSTNRINQALAASSAKIGAYGKAAIGGFVGGIVAGGVAGVVSQIGQVANSIAQIGDEAKRAGVSAEAFQEWKFVAEQNRIGIDQMTDGLKELNLRADEFVQTGKGSAAEAFMRLGYSADELKKKLTDPSALLLEIIDRLGKFDKAAQIRISDELFGGSAGERFVELIDQGEAGIRATIDRAHQLGVVMDDEMIAKAAELDRRFNAIANTVGSALKSAIVSAADSLVDFINKFRDFEHQRDYQLQDTLSGIPDRREEVQRQLDNIREMQENAVPDASGGYTWAKEIALWQAELDKIAADEARIMDILKQREEKVGNRAWTPPKPPPGGFGGSPSRDKAAQQAEREAEALRKLISDLEHELSVIGMSNTEKEIANTLRRAGVDATSKEGQQIAQLVTQIEAETEARKRQQEAVEKQKQAVDNLMQMATDGILSVMDGSVKAEDAVKKLAVQLALAAAQAALLGTGPLAGLFGGGGLFGGLFGGSSFVPNTTAAAFFTNGFSSGTANTGGQKGQPRGIVHGQEAVIPLPSGGRVPVQLQGGGSSSETRVKVEVGVEVDDEGKLQAFVKNVAQGETRAGLRKFSGSPEFQAGVIQGVRKAQSGNHKLG